MKKKMLFAGFKNVQVQESSQKQNGFCKSLGNHGVQQYKVHGSNLWHRSGNYYEMFEIFNEGKMSFRLMAFGLETFRLRQFA